MPAALPTGGTAVFALLTLIAAAFATNGVRLLFDGRYAFGILSLVVAILIFVAGLSLPTNYTVGILIFLVAILILMAGLKWVEVKLRLRDQRYWAGAVSVVILWFMIYALTYLHELRRDLDMYVMPRTITLKQAEDIRDYLAHAEKHTVTVKFSPLDQEANAYGSQIFAALKQSDWDVIVSTSDDEPSPRN